MEQRFRLGHIHDLTESIAKLVQERYEFSPGRAGEPQVIPLLKRLSLITLAAHPATA